MTFGERLIDLRKTRKYTREALAEELNISKYTLRNYELSVNEPGSHPAFGSLVKYIIQGRK